MKFVILLVIFVLSYDAGQRFKFWLMHPPETGSLKWPGTTAVHWDQAPKPSEPSDGYHGQWNAIPQTFTPGPPPLVIKVRRLLGMSDRK